MADYERLADAARARRAAFKSAEDVNRTWGKNLEDFFARLERQLGLEINSANLSMSRRGLPTFHGFSSRPEASAIEFSFGTGARCRVSLNGDGSPKTCRLLVEMIEGKMPYLLQYDLELVGTRVAAFTREFMGDSVGRVESTIDQIGTAIVAGVIHDRFA